MERVGKILGSAVQARATQARRVAAPSTVRSTSGGDRQRAYSHARMNERRSVPNSRNGQQETTDSEQSQTGTDPDTQQKPENRASYPYRRRRLGVQTDLTKVKSIISRVLAYRGLDKKVERYEFILRWHEIVGERLAEVSKPEYIRNRSLIVRVLHPAWAQELTMIKPVLLESLANFLKPGDVVTDMVFRVDTF